jgi:hypothetical protein
MPDLAPGASIRLRGLNNRATLNGATGTVEAYVEEKGRYAVLVDGIRFLVQPKNIVYLGHEAATSAVAAEHVVPGHPGLRARLDVLVTQAINQAALKEEAAGHSATVAAATSREDLPPHVWERVVEIMRLVDASTKWCDVGFPALQADALEAGDAATWSRATAEYAFYLLGQHDEEDWAARRGTERASPLDEARRQAQAVLRIRACGGRCRASMLASAVCAADGPFGRSAAEELLQHGLDECPAIDGAAWTVMRERAAMRKSLQDAWDADKHARLDERGAAMAAEVEAAAVASPARGAGDGHGGREG